MATNPPRSFEIPPFPFPNFIPGRPRLPSSFLLVPDVTPQGFPVTPPIPPTVQTGDIITASHENTVSTAINDLWIDLQSLAGVAVTDPTTSQGDLIVRGTAALSRLGVGATGTLLMADAGAINGISWASLSTAGGVPATRQVLAGAGMTGGGALTADVTLNAKVLSVNGQIGAVVLGPSDITSAGGVPATRTILPADATLTGGGDLSANRTFAVVADTSVQRIRYSYNGTLVGTRREVNLIPGANVTLAVADDTANNRINVTVAAAGGGSGGMVDPTTTLGDLIVRGTSTTVRLGAGAQGQVLTVDTAAGVGLKWAAPAGGVPTSRQVIAGTGLSGGGPLTADVTLNAVADSLTQLHVISQGGTLVGTRRETNYIAGANVTLTVADDFTNNRVNVTIAGPSVASLQTPWTSDIDAATFKLKNAGMIGIGIVNPQSLLHVVSTGATGATIETTNSAAGGFAILNLKTTNSFWQMAVGGMGTSTEGCWYLYTQTGGAFGLFANAAGYIGIGMTGTSRPQSLFQVGVGTPLAPGIADFYGPNRTTAQGTALLNVLTTDALAADKGGSLGLGGVGGSPSAYAFAVLAGRSENNAYAGYFQISTMTGAGTLTERMRVTSAGTIGIGITSPVNRLEVFGSTYAVPAISGSATDGTLRVGTAGHGEALDIGIMGSGVWLQARNFSAYASQFVLALNPNGGNVGIGQASPTHPLEVVSLIPVSAIFGSGSSGAVGVGYTGTCPFISGYTGVGAVTPAPLSLNPQGSNVGIGTSSIGVGYAGVAAVANLPVLDIKCNAAANSTLLRLISTPPTAGAYFAAIEFDVNETGTPNQAFNAARISAIFDFGAYNQARLTFSTPTGAGTWYDVMSLKGTAVGIGTTNPSVTLSTGAAISPIKIAAYDGGPTSCYGMGVASGFLTFGAAINGTSGTPQMVLSAAGLLGVGVANPGYRVDAAGDINCSGTFRVNGVAIGTGGVGVQVNNGTVNQSTTINFFSGAGINLSGGFGAGTFTLTIAAPSDIQLKQNVRTLSGGLPLIGRLRPITAEWNGLASTREGERLTSVIAQELQAVIPDAVYPYRAKLRPDDDKETELLGYDQMALTCHLILAVQQLERRLKALEN